MAAAAESRLGAWLREGDPAVVACVAELLAPEDLAKALEATLRDRDEPEEEDNNALEDEDEDEDDICPPPGFREESGDDGNENCNDGDLRSDGDDENDGNGDLDNDDDKRNDKTEESKAPEESCKNLGGGPRRQRAIPALAQAVALLAAQVSWVRAVAEAGQLQALGDLLGKNGIDRPGLAKAFQRTGHRGESALPFLEEHLYIQLVPTLGESDVFVQRLDLARRDTPGLHARWSEMLDPKARFEHGDMTCMCATGSVIASGSRQGVLQINELASGRLVFREPIAPAGEALVKIFAISPWRVACAWKSTLALVRIGDLLPGEVRIEMLTDDRPEIAGSVKVSSMARPDRHSGRLILATGWTDGVVRLWDADSGAWIGACEGHRGPVTALCTLQQGKNGADLASSSTDCTVRMWRCCVGKGATRSRGTLLGHVLPVQTLATVRDPESRREVLVSGSRDSSVRLWDTRHGAATGICRGHRGGVVSISCTRDGHILSASWDRSWILFDLAGRIVAQYQHKRGVQFVRLVNDALAVSVSTDNVIHMTDVRTGDCVAAWRNPNCICAVEVVRVDPRSRQDVVVFGCRAGRIGVYT